jgi:TRAP-type C4-dicarboxylate transport system substrate-binding protein
MIGVALAGWMVMSAGAASAIELRVASGAPPSFPVNNPTYTTFMSKVQEFSGGSITVSHLGPEVVNVPAMLSALENGTLDLGNVITSVWPADFPNMILIGEINGPWAVMLAATNEYMIHACKDCQEEFAKHGLLYLAALGSGRIELLTKKPVRTLADLKGLRLRSFSPQNTSFLEAMGAIPLSLPFNEEFPAIQSGVADGTLQGAQALLGNRLVEVVDYYTPFGLNSPANLATFPIRLETWKKLSVDERRAVVRAALHGAATFAPRGIELGKEGIEALLKKGGEVIQPSQEMIDASKAYEAGMVDKAIEKGKTVYGLADAEERVKLYVSLVEKWRPLIAPEIENDAEAVAELVWERVWSSVDFATFGVK